MRTSLEVIYNCMYNYYIQLPSAHKTEIMLRSHGILQNCSSVPQTQQGTKLNQDRPHGDTTSAFSTILGGVFGRFSGRSGIGSSSTSHDYQLSVSTVSVHGTQTWRQPRKCGTATEKDWSGERRFTHMCFKQGGSMRVAKGQDRVNDGNSLCSTRRLICVLNHLKWDTWPPASM